MAILPLIAPSLLSANFARLGQAVADLEKAGADMLHIDVMDGHFVPNLTLGPDIVKAIRPFSALPFDVHLMVSNPDALIPAFAQAGADWITVHAEATTHLDRTIAHIHSLGKKAGVSLVPSSSESMLEYSMHAADMILVMTVNPGFGGQAFLPSQLSKIRNIRKMIAESGRDIRLQVDGGITNLTAPQVVAAGADVLVAGSYILAEENIETYQNRIALLRASVANA
jgi:ribulose-phosphate 3-epimerase